MKALKIAAALAGFLCATAQARAVTFIDTNNPIATTGWYHLAVAGAQGGQNIWGQGGGGGALISGNVFLNQGTVLTVLFGMPGYQSPVGAPEGSGGSGGGMSFIAIGDTPLIVAGGGGGSYWTFGGSGGQGQIGQAGQFNPNIGEGAHGAGWLSDGHGVANGFEGGGGYSAPTYAGGQGYIGDPGGYGSYGIGADGGYGGGGGGGFGCGGGGGGYSGGGLRPGSCEAGGGGSYISPFVKNVVAIEGGNIAPTVYKRLFYPDGPMEPVFEYAEPGYAWISAVPEPSTWALFIIGFGMCGAKVRRSRSEKVRVQL